MAGFAARTGQPALRRSSSGTPRARSSVARPSAVLAADRPAPVGSAQLLSLQASAGNQAVAELVRSGGALQRLADPSGTTAPPAPPSGLRPFDDPAFLRMKVAARHKAQQLKSHPRPRTEADAARAAAEPPSNHKASQAKAAQVEEMGAAKPGTFDQAAFVAAVRAAIAAAAPTTMKEADEYKSSGKATAVKGQVMANVTGAKQSSTADIKGKTQQAPDPSRAVEKPVVRLAPTPRIAKPGDPGSARAMPKPAPPEQTNFAGPSNEVAGEMAAKGVSEEQLAKSNEPEFQAALDAKKEGEQHSAQAPGEIRTHEAQTLNATKSGAAITAKTLMTAMTGAKRSAVSGVGGDKSTAKTADEAARQKVASDIEAMYSATKADTEKILGDLDGKVDTEFQNGEKKAREDFEAFQAKEVSDWKWKRYVRPIGGMVRWGIDQFRPLSPALKRIFEKAKARYLALMDAVIRRVAATIGAELTKARKRIADGKTQIAKFVKSQTGDLARIARETQSAVAGKFEELEQSVDDKQQGLVDDLASRYVEARSGIDERIAALQDANKGYWQKAKDAIGGAIETVLKLKDMLLGILARAAGAVEKIIKDPIGFLGNLVAAVRAGFDRYVANIGSHLKKGLMGWLFGQLGAAGITLPEKWDLKGIVGLLASLGGLTWANFQQRLVKKAGPKVAGAVVGGVGFIQQMAGGNLLAPWEMIVTKVATLKDSLMGQIQDLVITKVITAGVKWIIGLLNPAAAFIKACKMIYDVVMFFVEKAADIKELVDAILDSVEDIVAGGTGKVAGLIEGVLAKLTPLAIGLLASVAGIGSLGSDIQKLLKKAAKPVNKVFDWVIGKAVSMGKGLLRKLKNSKLGRKAADLKQRGTAWVKNKARALGERLGLIKKPFTAGKESHTLSVDLKSGAVKMASVEGPAADKVRHYVDKMRAVWRRAGKEPPSVDDLVASVTAKISAITAGVQAKTQGKGSAAKAQLDRLAPIITDLMLKLGAIETSVPTPPTGIGNIAPYGGQVPSHDPADPKNGAKKMIREHVVPADYVSMLHEGLGYEGVTSTEYEKMHTIMIYKGAADMKTHGSTTADNALRNQLREIMKVGMPRLAGSSRHARELRRRGVNIGAVRERFEAKAAHLRESLIPKLPAIFAGRVELTVKVVKKDHEEGNHAAERGHADPLPSEAAIRSAASRQADDVAADLLSRL